MKEKKTNINLFYNYENVYFIMGKNLFEYFLLKKIENILKNFKKNTNLKLKSVSNRKNFCF